MREPKSAHFSMKLCCSLFCRLGLTRHRLWLHGHDQHFHVATLDETWNDRDAREASALEREAHGLAGEDKVGAEIDALLMRLGWAAS
jgi:hypothetical protein